MRRAQAALSAPEACPAILTHCEVTNYLEFRQIAGSYVFRDGAISKVPANEAEASRRGAKVIRAICLLTHPIPNTDDADSAQIIIPQNQVGRTSDIYIAAVSSGHRVCAPGYYVAMVSTVVETDDPNAEIEPALNLLGPIADMFVSIIDLHEPVADGADDHVYVSKSYDATSHFETVCDDVFDLYKRRLRS
ncbi:hypothetical protein AMAG_18281 [Allomyces macrogynus ATCC 38327]|uniref:Rab GDP dissociation inhibitor n=1 Tax=Allomyces macrogynus (strain ATCC 38327) TaxID=578462 RepID=A0A0L0S891_ALLM3|nr:hypothetical protein AMAG_18281 [Allomyces macrogynus ATCC 38327]|eukprot:KNE58625.1 hypothetical protein AMAG_18281 [Allomyces macrogynus ATCC 38327]